MERQLYYLRLYLKRGTRMFWRNRFASVMLTLVLTLLLFVVYIFVAMSAHTAQAARNVDDKLVITALIAQDGKYKSVVPATTVANEIRRLPGVRDARIVSEDETRARFLANVNGLESKPAAYIFQEAVEVSVTDVDRLAAIRDRIAAIDGVDKADYLADIAEKLTAVSDYIRAIALAGAILLTVITLLVVMAVVRSAVHAEARSVATMASVGGSNWTIAAPMVLYLLLVVMIASALACTAGWWIDPQLGGALGKNITSLPDWLQTGRAFALGVLWLPLVVGAGLATSLIAVWSTFRYSRQQYAAS